MFYCKSNDCVIYCFICEEMGVDFYACIIVVSCSVILVLLIYILYQSIINRLRHKDGEKKTIKLFENVFLF